MNRFRFVLLVLFFAAPVTANAAVVAGDFPDGTVWYMHADLKEMRTSDSGRDLFAWLDEEVLTEFNEETGVDLKEEIDRITAFSSGGRGAIIVIEGAISQDTQDKLLAIASLDGSLDMLTYNGKSYYHAGKERSDDGDGHFEKAAYFSFALKNKIIVTTDEDKLKNLLDSNGKIAGTRGADNALFVLTAEKEFMQAGMQTGIFGGDGIDWDSNILRNIEQAAVLISGKAGLIAIEAQLISSDPGMAKSIASIVNGLISLQAFATDLEPDLAAILQNTKVDVEGNVLSIRTVIDPKTIVKIISD